MTVCSWISTSVNASFYFWNLSVWVVYCKLGCRNIERVLLFLVGCRIVVREGISCDRLKDVEL